MRGALEQALDLDPLLFDRWLDHHPENQDLELTAQAFLESREDDMPTITKKPAAAKVPVGNADKFVLPTGRRKPSSNPWELAYLITGEKKIGKTTFAVEGCEEYVLQFDKPQLTYNIRETSITSWKHFMKVLRAIEQKAESGDFPFERIIIDGAGEWYQMMQAEACKHFGVEHPSEEGYARCWHYIRDNFLDAVNRLLRMQSSVSCGLIFIAHSEWKERNKQEVLVPNLPSKCEEILNGKCDGWFNYGYQGSERVLTIRGDETIAAGHRIDGHFMTTDGRRVSDIHMGDSPKDALRNFLLAFNNEQTYADHTEWKEQRKAAPAVTQKKKFIVKR